ncbi:MAG: electron transfer flavoprotein subunit beta/FixA family protein [Phycisphaerae bacterium]|nr:electron transfer flavoprotein subunit beta/FixA family protein [Phycisphaerae bacterium]
MDIVVLIKFVPDLVEDLEIDAGTGLLDRSFLRLMPNELDDHALEEALLLKERHGGSVTVLTLDSGDVDETLFTAIAKGADRVIKLTGEGFDQGPSNQRIAGTLRQALSGIHFDLILTGTQAVDDLDGFVGALLAEQLKLPYVGYITKITAGDGHLVVQKEYPGGLNAEIEVSGPAVLGIQAAEKPPRYVVTSKVMEAMKTAKIEEIAVDGVTVDTEVPVSAMAVPESGSHAEMIEGNVQQVAEKLAALLRERGVVA